MPSRVALIEAGSPGLNVYSHVAMGRGVPLLATVLRDAGYEVRAFVEDISGKDSIDWEFVACADVVGFSAITCTLPRTGRLIGQVRSLNPRATILLGGPEPTCEPQRSFAIGADMVLRGEAELTLPRLLGALLEGSGEQLEHIPGLLFREGDRVHEGLPARQLTSTELDALPLVDWSLVTASERMSVTPIWRTRGCAQRCSFCEVHEIWPKPSMRDGERAVEDVMRAQEVVPPMAFLIDDNAAANKPAFVEFLRSLAAHGYVGSLVAQLRADAFLDRQGRIDKELLRLMKQAANVVTVCVGVESADDEDLARLKKRLDSSRMARALRAMRRSGVLVHGMFIALRDDSGEVIRRNGAWARRYVTSLQYAFEVPLPGTQRTAEIERDGALLFDDPDSLELCDGMHVTVRPDKMAPSELQALVTREYRRFYSAWRIALAALGGLFARHRLLSDAQRAYLRHLDPRKRLLAWARFHLEYKFAPASLLVIGRHRVRAFMRDPEYARYRKRLEAL